MYESSQRMHARYSLDSSWILRFSLATSIAVRDLFCCRALYLSLLLSCFLSSHTLQTHSFVRRTTSSKLVAHKPISRFIIIIVSHCIHAPSNKKFFSFHTEFWIFKLWLFDDLRKLHRYCAVREHVHLSEFWWILDFDLSLAISMCIISATSQGLNGSHS